MAALISTTPLQLYSVWSLMSCMLKVGDNVCTNLKKREHHIPDIQIIRQDGLYMDIFIKLTIKTH